MQKRKPNIILINCDDMGYGDLGCYGSAVNKTPNIDKLAENGLLFTDFYMASPVCSPSRGAMLTGCYPPRIGFGSFEGKGVLFPGQGVGLNPEEKTIASMLKEAGYSTMIIGKWHCGDQPEFLPLNHGFDHYYGLPYSNDMGRQRRPWDWQFCPLPLIADEEVIQQQPDLSSLTERYTEQAVRYIRDNKENPFFLYFAHMYVHLPHYAPSRFHGESENGDFGAVMGCLDWSVSVLVDELKKQGLENDTLIVFTSDNGGTSTHGGSNSPLRGAKHTTWEGGMRVPCICCWPGHIPAGKKESRIACSLDFYSTFAAIVGADVNDGVIRDSMDISQLLFSESLSDDAAGPRSMVFYYNGNNLDAVRCGNWKLKLRDHDDQIKALYNLADDVSESVNVYDAYPQKVAELTALMAECRLDLGDAAQGIAGQNIRAIGSVDNPKTLTEYDPQHPYIIAMYDKEEFG